MKYKITIANSGSFVLATKGKEGLFLLIRIFYRFYGGFSTVCSQFFWLRLMKSFMYAQKNYIYFFYFFYRW
jgi:hypothetical protein